MIKVLYCFMFLSLFVLQGNAYDSCDFDKVMSCMNAKAQTCERTFMSSMRDCEEGGNYMNSVQFCIEQAENHFQLCLSNAEAICMVRHCRVLY